MPSTSRPELAAHMLARGARLNGLRICEDASGVRQAGDALRAAGVGQGDVVGIAAESAEQIVFTSVAAWMVDAVPWPIASATRYATECDAIVDGDGMVSKPSAPRRRMELESVAVLHNTSGSTAVSKTAKRGIASVLQEAEGYRSRMGLSESDSVSIPLPLSHSFGFGVVFASLLCGCNVVAASGRPPSVYSADLDQGRTNILFATPSLARLIASTPRLAQHKTEGMFIGAGQVTEQLHDLLVHRFGGDVSCGYGSTETGGVMAGKRGIGRPIPGVRIAWPPAGSSGELVIASDAPILGYLGSDRPKLRVWRTGDVVFRPACAEEDVRFVRRSASDVLRVNGVFVDTGDLRAAVARMPEVRDIATFVAQDRAGAGVEALYVAVETDIQGVSQLRMQLLSCMAGHAPRLRVVACPSFPRNEIGKLDREQLLRLIGERNARDH